MNTENDRSFAELIRQVVADLQEIVRSEVRLARAEVREEVGKAAGAAKMSAAGAVIGLYAGGFLLLSVVWLLERYMSNWMAALLTAVVLGITAAILISSGRKQLKDVRPKPEKTIESIKENLQWNRNPNV